MIASSIRIQAVRGFQAECEIPLSPTVTVIHGDNGRGKTSLCEGWHWLFTGGMLEGLEPRSEVGAAVKNIHTNLEPQVRLLDDKGGVLAERLGETFQNPGNLPTSTSPVLLQYRLHQVLYTSQADRRRFFEEVLELEVESEFAQKLRRACQGIDPFSHPAWQAWKRAVDAVTDQGFEPPHPSPSSPSQQQANEKALLEFVSSYFGCDATAEGIEQALEEGSRKVDLSIDEVTPPVSEAVATDIEEALSAIESFDAEIEAAIERSLWQERGLSFVEPPKCPFCGEDTIDDAKLSTIRRGIEEAAELRRVHAYSASRLEKGVNSVLPLAQLDIESAQDHLSSVIEAVEELEVKETGQILAGFANLAVALGQLDETRPSPEDLRTPEVFRNFASAVLEVSRVWLDLVPELQILKQSLEGRRVRVHYTESATSILQYHRIDRQEFYAELHAQPILAEIADAAPRTIESIKQHRLGSLAGEISQLYGILRPDDPTPLEAIEAAGGIKGDIRILARSKDRVQNASALFSHSNANAVGIAAHVARVLDSGHRTVVFDDPFQSLDDTNREQVIRNLISRLLDEDIQVVVLTHESAAAQKLLNMYADRGAIGTALRWDTDNGAFSEPMYPSGDAQLSMVLDGLEADDPSEILKVASALRQLIEGFCAKYLSAVGKELPPSNRRTLGSYIAKLEALHHDLRPSADRLEILKDWNSVLSDEAHLAGSGASGMSRLKGIAREAIQAQIQEKQLRPPDQNKWTTIPRSEGIKDRCKRILGAG